MPYYYLKRIIEYGLYLLVFLLPIQTRWIIRAGENEYLTVSLYGTDVLLILLVGLLLVIKFQSAPLADGPAGGADSKSQIKFKIQSHWWFIAGLDLMVFISIFFAADKLIAIYRYGLFLLGVGLFWLIISAGYNKMKLIYSLLAGIFLQACLAIWQFLTQSDFACKWLGMALHRAGDLGISVIETLEGERWLRAYGGLDHPNVLGGLLVVGLLLFLGLFVTKCDSSIMAKRCGAEARAVDNDLQHGPTVSRGTAGELWSRQIPAILRDSGQIQNIVLLFAFCFLLSALFFTFSRGAWLGLAVGLLAMFFATVIKEDLRGQKKLLQIILTSSVLIFILFSQFHDLAMTRLATGARLEIKSNVERMESYKDSWRIIKDNWLFGAGAGNYVKYNANPRSASPAARERRSGLAERSEYTNDNAKPNWYYQPVHNVFLLVWAEIGIIGPLFFIGLLLCVINRKRSKNLIVRIPLLAAMIAMFLVDHWWWSLHFGVLFFWLALGLLISRGESVKQAENIKFDNGKA
ncbi:MAG: O-antigen ligase family protein [Patescibacteria group bacterium]|nr:O-antigen ligase family protein [Patescibacteria group bacterium]